MSRSSVIRLFSTSRSKGAFRDRFVGEKGGRRDDKGGAQSFCQHYLGWHMLRVVFCSANQWEGA